MKEHHAKSHAEKKPHAELAGEPKAPPAGTAPARDAAAELAALKDRLLRLQADFDNFRKRALRERGELSQRAIEELVTALLPVVDHFRLGLKTAGEHGADPAMTDGFTLVYQQLMAALTKHGLAEIEAEGKPFDPHLHHAVTHVPSDAHPADTVLTQTGAGYRLGDRLLRAAQVVVSSGPPASDEEPAAEPPPANGPSPGDEI